MKPRTIVAAVFIAAMLICGGAVLRGWQMKHPPRPQEMRGDNRRDDHDMMGGDDWRLAHAKERAEAIDCIGGQLDAFRKDDYVKAITYQSAVLHSQFSSPLMFRSMIRSHYPDFANAKKVVYGHALADKGGRMIAMDVEFTGANNHDVKARYRLIREQSGYRVMGVGDIR